MNCMLSCPCVVAPNGFVVCFCYNDNSSSIQGGRLCRVRVNSDPVSVESVAGAGERLCGPDVSMEVC